MPELPEIEVTRLGVAPHVENHQVTDLVLRTTGLRWPFPEQLKEHLIGQVVRKTSRRGKYLLLHFDQGILMFHLGMSGHLRVLPLGEPPKKHDHVDLVMENEVIRMTDPRRFGALLWHDMSQGDVLTHPLLSRLGVEPLTDQFTAQLLYKETRTRHSAIKQVLLSGDIVVGVGNIYASESLFKAGIRPTTAASRISQARYEKLVVAIKETLAEAIQKGGSTLRDFMGVNGQSGYFQQNYFVYAREGQPCRVCGHPVQQIKQGQRSTFFCGVCQR